MLIDGNRRPDRVLQPGGAGFHQGLEYRTHRDHQQSLASFDAAGGAGIINIVYRREEALGLHATSASRAGVGRPVAAQALYPSELGSYDFNPRTLPTGEPHL